MNHVHRRRITLYGTKTMMPNQHDPSVPLSNQKSCAKTPHARSYAPSKHPSQLPIIYTPSPPAPQAVPLLQAALPDPAADTQAAVVPPHPRSYSPRLDVAIAHPVDYYLTPSALPSTSITIRPCKWVMYARNATSEEGSGQHTSHPA